MSLKLNTEELKKVLELFYTLSGIRIVIFDKDYREIISYPTEKCSFCNAVSQNKVLGKCCVRCDINAFEECKKTKEVFIYKCHAGLVEAAMPLKDKNKIIGYIMFGQITDIKDKSELNKFTCNINNRYNLNCTANGIKYKSKKQIGAVSNLLEMCTNYILIKEMVASQNTYVTERAKEYIEKNLSEKIKIADICKYAKVSRTGLYEIFSRDCGIGVSAYIRSRRLVKARELLINTCISVSETADIVGFSDYNYFSRVYKKEYGISPHKTKKIHQDE